MKLREKRIERGYTQEQVAELLKTDVPSISRFENYKCLPVPYDMQCLCEILDCEIKDIYKRKEITFALETKTPPVQDDYKLTVRLPPEAKEQIAHALRVLEYSGVTSWIYQCYKALIAEAKNFELYESNLRKRIGKSEKV